MGMREAFAEAAARKAASYLQDRRFRVLDRDWRCDSEVIPAVAADQRALVAVDLRARTGTGHSTPLDAIAPARTRALRRLAARWMTAHGTRYDQVRIDVVGLLQDAGGFTIEHVRGAG